MVHPLWTVCLFVRFAIACAPVVLHYTASDPRVLLSARVLLATIGIGFLYKYMYGSNEEVQFANVFWHHTRIVHALLYLIAAWQLNHPFVASSVLLADMCFSVSYRILSGR